MVNPPNEALAMSGQSSGAVDDVSTLSDTPPAGEGLSPEASDTGVAMEQKPDASEKPAAEENVSDVASVSAESSAPSGESNSQESDNVSKLSDSTSKLSVTNRLVSFGFQAASGRKIDTVVLHSTYNPLGGDPYSVSKAIDIYKSYGVSPHYIVARDGKVYRLVEEKNIAYHAGDSKVPDGRTNVNSFSIGIEVLTKETDDEPTKAQYSALRALLADIKSRSSIKYILGHSDIAPGRKTDPWGFDWKEVGGKKK